MTNKEANITKKPEKLTFDAQKRRFERAYALLGSNGCESALYPLAATIANSVLRRIADPSAAKAPEHSAVSDGGCSPVIAAARRDVLDAFGRRDKDGNTHSGALYDVTAGDLCPDMDAALEYIAGDGADVVQTAACALLELASVHAVHGGEWLDRRYTVRRIDKRVTLQRVDSAAVREVETMPILEVFRSVRRYIGETRAVRANVTSSFQYVPYQDGDGVELYHRLPRYMDDISEYEDELITTYVARMKLNPRQAAVLRLRMLPGRPGCRAIGTYLGIKHDIVARTIRQIRAAAGRIGLTLDILDDDDARRVIDD